MMAWWYELHSTLDLPDIYEDVGEPDDGNSFKTFTEAKNNALESIQQEIRAWQEIARLTKEKKKADYFS